MDGNFFNFIPTNEQILDIILNFDREYGLFLKKFKEKNEKGKSAMFVQKIKVERNMKDRNEKKKTFEAERK